MGTSTDTVGQRIGIMGGSFDPIHIGHLLAAEHCREQLGLDNIRFMPASISPFKTDKEKKSADARHRLEMLHLATVGNPAFAIDDRELRRGGVSFTVETLRELRAELPDAQIVFLMGADSLADFEKWKEPAEICRLAFVAVVARGGSAPPDMDILKKFLPEEQRPQLQSHLIQMPQCEISSSHIRNSITAGRSVRYQLPAAVEAYIRQHELYTRPNS